METGILPLIELSEEDDVSRPATSKRRSRVRNKQRSEEDTEGGSTVTDGKSVKYTKKYKPQWETLEVFANWLHRTPEHLLKPGKGEAYCSFCQQTLRAHKTDLLSHAKSRKHMEAAINKPTSRDCRSFIESYVPDLDDQAKSESMYEVADPPSTRSRGTPKPIANKAVFLEQINVELEETEEKIKVCEEELSSLRMKKARLEFEFEYYNNN